MTTIRSRNPASPRTVPTTCGFALEHHDARDRRHVSLRHDVDTETMIAVMQQSALTAIIGLDNRLESREMQLLFAYNEETMRRAWRVGCINWYVFLTT